MADAQQAELAALAREKEEGLARIAELEAIIRDEASSIVKRSRAQVELASLHKRFGVRESRASVRALLGGSQSGGLVTKNAAAVEREIALMERRKREREEEIARLREALQGRELSRERRAQLEKELEEAQKEAEELALDVSEHQRRRSTLKGEEGMGAAKEVEKADAEAEAPPTVDTSESTADGDEADEEEEEDLTASEITRRRARMLDANRMSDIVEGDSEEETMSPGSAGFLTSPEPSFTTPGGAASLGASVGSAGASAGSIGASFNSRASGASPGGGLPRVPSLDVEDGGDDEDLRARIRELELEVKKWKAKATELEETCEDLKDEKGLQNIEILALKDKVALGGRPSLVSTGGRPSLSSTGSRGSRRFSTRALGNPSLRSSLQRQSMMGLSVDEQMRAEAGLEMKALEERLKEIDGEKGELLAELATMRAILENTSDDDGKKKVERLVYQLSCKKCDKLKNCVGTTKVDLKTTIGKHIDRVVETTKKGKAKSAGDANDEKDGKREKWSEEFCAHFAKHCQSKFPGKSKSEKDVIKFCRANIKCEVLRRHDGAELMWEMEEDS